MTQSTAPPTTGSTKRRRVPVKLIVALVLVALAIVFIVQNRQETNIYLLLWTISGPLWSALTGVLVFGGVAGFLLVRRRQ